MDRILLELQAMSAATTAAGPSRWFFDAWSVVYDLPLVQRLTYRPVQDAVVAALQRARPRRVLDVGCGTGLLATRLHRELAGTAVVGCDFSHGMLVHARRHPEPVSWVEGDALRLPLRDGIVDAVVSTEAFHWFPDQRRALAECFRVLAPGGRIMIALVSTPSDAVRALFRLASRAVGQPFDWPTRGEMRALLRESGFRVERQQRVFRLPGMLLLPAVLTVGVRPP